jgi:hypothetical protein
MRGSFTRRRPLSRQEYVRTIQPKVAQSYKEIYRIAVPYAFGWLRHPRSVHPACRADLKADINNAKDVAADLFTKWMSGDRQDWNGDQSTLRDAVGSGINSILSGRFKRHDNVNLSYIEDIQLDRLFDENQFEEDLLSPVNWDRNQKRKLELIEQLFPRVGFETEVLILSTMIVAGIYNANDVAKYLGLAKRELNDALKKIANYTKTEQFAVLLHAVFSDQDTGRLQENIQKLAEEVVEVRCRSEVQN